MTVNNTLTNSIRIKYSIRKNILIYFILIIIGVTIIKNIKNQEIIKNSQILIIPNTAASKSSKLNNLEANFISNMPNDKILSDFISPVPTSISGKNKSITKSTTTPPKVNQLSISSNGITYSKAQTVKNGQLSFSGKQWDIDNSGDKRWGPNDNLWSDNAWVDQYNQMHLEVKKDNNDQWTCALAALSEKAGYGYYKAVINNENDRLLYLDKNVVFGFFTYDTFSTDPGNLYHREIDILEATRWSQTTVPLGNAEATIQHGTNDIYSQFQIKPGQKELTFEMTWKPGLIEIYGPESLNGTRYHLKYEDQPDSTNKYVPDPGNAKLMFNLWLHNNQGENLPGSPPSNGKDQEVIIKSFSYSPMN